VLLYLNKFHIRDELRNVLVMEARRCGLALHGKQTWIENCK